MNYAQLKALVVDDSKIALLDIQSKLSSFIPRENIYLAQNYYDAVNLLREHDFGVAFIDLQMPEKTGMDLILDVIYQDPKTRKIPVVVTTSARPDSLLTHTLEKITFRYLFKPVGKEELEEALSNIPMLNK